MKMNFYRLGGRTEMENLREMDLHATVGGTFIVSDKFLVWMFPVTFCLFAYLQNLSSM